MFLGVSVIESAVSCLGHMVMPDFFVNFVLTMFDIYVFYIWVSGSYSVHLVELRETGKLFAMKAMDKSVMLNRNKVHLLEFPSQPIESKAPVKCCWNHFNTTEISEKPKEIKKDMVLRRLFKENQTNLCSQVLKNSASLKLLFCFLWQVHRVWAERDILELMDHPFLPTLYASFQVRLYRAPIFTCQYHFRTTWECFKRHHWLLVSWIYPQLIMQMYYYHYPLIIGLIPEKLKLCVFISGNVQTKTHVCLITDFCPGGELFALLERQPCKAFSEEAVR